MALVYDYSEKEEFNSDRYCNFCNSQEGKIRMVGNYIVELSEIELREEVKLACQSCRIKQRNFQKAVETQNKRHSFFSKIFSFI